MAAAGNQAPTATAAEANLIIVLCANDGSSERTISVLRTMIGDYLPDAHVVTTTPDDLAATVDQFPDAGPPLVVAAVPRSTADTCLAVALADSDVITALWTPFADDRAVTVPAGVTHLRYGASAVTAPSLCEAAQATFVAAWTRLSATSPARVAGSIDRARRHDEPLIIDDLLPAVHPDRIPSDTDAPPETDAPISTEVGVIHFGRRRQPDELILAPDPMWARPHRVVRLLTDTPWHLDAVATIRASDERHAVATLWGHVDATSIVDLVAPGYPQSITIELGREIGAGAVVEAVERLAERHWLQGWPRITVRIKAGYGTAVERKRAADRLRELFPRTNRASISIKVDPEVDTPTEVYVDGNVLTWADVSAAFGTRELLEALKASGLSSRVAALPEAPKRPGHRYQAQKKKKRSRAGRPTSIAPDDLVYILCTPDPDLESEFNVKTRNTFLGITDFAHVHTCTPADLRKKWSALSSGWNTARNPVVLVALEGAGLATVAAAATLPPPGPASIVYSHSEALALALGQDCPPRRTDVTFGIVTGGSTRKSGPHSPQTGLEVCRRIQFNQAFRRTFRDSRDHLVRAAIGNPALAELLEPLRNRNLNPDPAVEHRAGLTHADAEEAELLDEHLSPWVDLMSDLAPVDVRSRSTGFVLLRNPVIGLNHTITLGFPRNTPQHVGAAARMRGPHHGHLRAVHFGAEHSVARLLDPVVTQHPDAQLRFLIGRGRDIRPITAYIRRLAARQPRVPISVVFEDIDHADYVRACDDLMALRKQYAHIHVRIGAVHPDECDLFKPEGIAARRTSQPLGWQRRAPRRAPHLPADTLQLLAGAATSLLKGDRNTIVPTEPQPRGDVAHAKHVMIVTTHNGKFPRGMPLSILERKYGVAFVLCEPDQIATASELIREQRNPAAKPPIVHIVADVSAASATNERVRAMTPEEAPDTLWLPNGPATQRISVQPSPAGTTTLLVYSLADQTFLRVIERALDDAARNHADRNNYAQAREVSREGHPLADPTHPLADHAELIRGELAGPDPPRAGLDPATLWVDEGVVAAARHRTIYLPPLEPAALLTAFRNRTDRFRFARTTIFGNIRASELAERAFRYRAAQQVTFQVHNAQLLETAIEAAVLTAEAFLGRRRAASARGTTTTRTVHVDVGDAAIQPFIDMLRADQFPELVRRHLPLTIRAGARILDFRGGRRGLGRAVGAFAILRSEQPTTAPRAIATSATAVSSTAATPPWDRLRGGNSRGVSTVVIVCPRREPQDTTSALRQSLPSLTDADDTLVVRCVPALVGTAIERIQQQLPNVTRVEVVARPEFDADPRITAAVQQFRTLSDTEELPASVAGFVRILAFQAGEGGLELVGPAHSSSTGQLSVLPADSAPTDPTVDRAPAPKPAPPPRAPATARPQPAPLRISTDADYLLPPTAALNHLIVVVAAEGTTADPPTRHQLGAVAHLVHHGHRNHRPETAIISCTPETLADTLRTTLGDHTDTAPLTSVFAWQDSGAATVQAVCNLDGTDVPLPTIVWVDGSESAHHESTSDDDHPISVADSILDNQAQLPPSVAFVDYSAAGTAPRVQAAAIIRTARIYHHVRRAKPATDTATNTNTTIAVTQPRIETIRSGTRVIQLGGDQGAPARARHFGPWLEYGAAPVTYVSGELAATPPAVAAVRDLAIRGSDLDPAVDDSGSATTLVRVLLRIASPDAAELATQVGLTIRELSPNVAIEFQRDCPLTPRQYADVALTANQLAGTPRQAEIDLLAGDAASDTVVVLLSADRVSTLKTRLREANLNLDNVAVMRLAQVQQLPWLLREYATSSTTTKAVYVLAPSHELKRGRPAHLAVSKAVTDLRDDTVVAPSSRTAPLALNGWRLAATATAGPDALGCASPEPFYEMIVSTANPQHVLLWPTDDAHPADAALVTDITEWCAQQEWPTAVVRCRPADLAIVRRDLYQQFPDAAVTVAGENAATALTGENPAVAEALPDPHIVWIPRGAPLIDRADLPLCTLVARPRDDHYRFADIAWHLTHGLDRLDTLSARLAEDWPRVSTSDYYTRFHAEHPDRTFAAIAGQATESSATVVGMLSAADFPLATLPTIVVAEASNEVHGNELEMSSVGESRAIIYFGETAQERADALAMITELLQLADTARVPGHPRKRATVLLRRDGDTASDTIALVERLQPELDLYLQLQYGGTDPATAEAAAALADRMQTAAAVRETERAATARTAIAALDPSDWRNVLEAVTFDEPELPAAADQAQRIILIHPAPNDPDLITVLARDTTSYVEPIAAADDIPEAVRRMRNASGSADIVLITLPGAAEAVYELDPDDSAAQPDVLLVAQADHDDIGATVLSSLLAGSTRLVIDPMPGDVPDAELLNSVLSRLRPASSRGRRTTTTPSANDRATLMAASTEVAPPPAVGTPTRAPYGTFGAIPRNAMHVVLLVVTSAQEVDKGLIVDLASACQDLKRPFGATWCQPRDVPRALNHLHTTYPNAEVSIGGELAAYDALESWQPASDGWSPSYLWLSVPRVNRNVLPGGVAVVHYRDAKRAQTFRRLLAHGTPARTALLREFGQPNGLVWRPGPNQPGVALSGANFATAPVARLVITDQEPAPLRVTESTLATAIVTGGSTPNDRGKIMAHVRALSELTKNFHNPKRTLTYVVRRSDVLGDLGSVIQELGTPPPFRIEVEVACATATPEAQQACERLSTLSGVYLQRRSDSSQRHGRSQAIPSKSSPAKPAQPDNTESEILLRRHIDSEAIRAKVTKLLHAPPRSAKPGRLLSLTDNGAAIVVEHGKSHNTNLRGLIVELYPDAAAAIPYPRPLGKHDCLLQLIGDVTPDATRLLTAGDWTAIDITIRDGPGVRSLLTAVDELLNVHPERRIRLRFAEPKSAELVAVEAHYEVHGPPVLVTPPDRLQTIVVLMPNEASDIAIPMVQKLLGRGQVHVFHTVIAAPAVDLVHRYATYRESRPWQLIHAYCPSTEYADQILTDIAALPAEQHPTTFITPKQNPTRPSISSEVIRIAEPRTTFTEDMLRKFAARGLSQQRFFAEQHAAARHRAEGHPGRYPFVAPDEHELEPDVPRSPSMRVRSPVNYRAHDTRRMVIAKARTPHGDGTPFDPFEMRVEGQVPQKTLLRLLIGGRWPSKLVIDVDPKHPAAVAALRTIQTILTYRTPPSIELYIVGEQGNETAPLINELRAGQERGASIRVQAAPITIHSDSPEESTSSVEAIRKLVKKKHSPVRTQGGSRVDHPSFASRPDINVIVLATATATATARTALCEQWGIDAGRLEFVDPATDRRGFRYRMARRRLLATTPQASLAVVALTEHLGDETAIDVDRYLAELPEAEQPTLIISDIKCEQPPTGPRHVRFATVSTSQKLATYLHDPPSSTGVAKVDRR